MADIKLFRVTNSHVEELSGLSVAVEKSLQKLIEKHLEAFLGVRFLATEHSTGKTHGGRIDTLGLDENGFPVIVEYKRSLNENVINQGLFYLNWLLDHRAEFELMVLKAFGDPVYKQIDWSNPRLLCIAGDFTKYDEHAVQQINRNIELIRYRKYGDELILFELVNAVSVQPTVQEEVGKPSPTYPMPKTVVEKLESSPTALSDLFYELDAFIMALGDDVQKKSTKYYFAYKRIKNFACVEIHPHAHHMLIYLKVDPIDVNLEEGFSRDVSNIGHWGTGDLEVRVADRQDLEKAKSLLLKSYETS